MSIVRIELHLEKEDAAKLSELAKHNNRSRKNFCETQLKAIIQNNSNIPNKQEPIKPQSISTPVVLENSIDAYLAEIKDAKSLKSIENTMKEVWKDKSLNPIEKQKIEAFAKIKGREIDLWVE